jgi:SatD family (SatD)
MARGRSRRVEEPMYLALIGDVVGSRELSDRAEVQRRLQATIGELNVELVGALAAPLKLVAGDEVEGLLIGGEAVVDVVVALADALHPAALAWGLGLGPLTTDLSEDVSVVDGPCLHLARGALESWEAKERWLSPAGIDAPAGVAIGALFTLMWAIRAHWTDTQLRYVRGARLGTQQDVAERFGVSKQAVSKVLASARFHAVEQGEAAARALLRGLAPDPTGGSGAAEGGRPSRGTPGA